MNNYLLIIDPQVDFHPGGSLPVVNADHDSRRVAKFIREKSKFVSEILVTLDSHHRIHIAHGIFWTNAEGQSPSPFTLITNEDIRTGVWRPRDPTKLEHCMFYTEKLEAMGRFKLCIWPEHCLIGTPGHAVFPDLNQALQEWAGENLKEVEYIMKGTNSLVEMYSALAAEVELASDPSTQFDPTFIDIFDSVDRLIVCGEALSHCVNFTVRDIAKHWRREMWRIVILRDCSSPVPGFEAAAEQFLEDMTVAGLTICTSEDLMAQLEAEALAMDQAQFHVI